MENKQQGDNKHVILGRAVVLQQVLDGYKQGILPKKEFITFRFTQHYVERICLLVCDLTCIHICIYDLVQKNTLFKGNVVINAVEI